MDLSWDRRTPGPIVHPYRGNLREDWGVMLSASGNVWLLSFGAFGGAIALGWVTRTRRFEQGTRFYGRRNGVRN